MSQYVLNISGKRETHFWDQHVEVGWDPIHQVFSLASESTPHREIPIDEPYKIIADSFEDLLEQVKSRNRLVGIRGLGFMGRLLRALESNLRHDQEHNLHHDISVYEGTAEEISEKELLS